jgi:hypothetical protein
MLKSWLINKWKQIKHHIKNKFVFGFVRKANEKNLLCGESLQSYHLARNKMSRKNLISNKNVK